MGTPPRRELNDNAVPTIFAFNCPGMKRKSTEERIKKREKRQVCQQNFIKGIKQPRPQGLFFLFISN